MLDSLFFMVISTLLFPLFFILVICIFRSKIKKERSTALGKAKNSVRNDVPFFRDIPCNGDIFLVYWVAVNYNLLEKREDFLGAILLKWIHNGNVRMEKVIKNNFLGKKECIHLIFCKRPEDTFDLEDKIYDFMYESSRDGILESNEFVDWCGRNASKLLSWFDDVLYFQTMKLLKQGKVSYSKGKKSPGFSYSYFDIDPSMMEEAEKLAGLKKFLEEFTLIHERKIIEVQLWKEYLIYAQMFGLADKVTDQFEKLYPDIIIDMKSTGYLYQDMGFIGLAIASLM